jgi:NAD-dependent deacetylase
LEIVAQRLVRARRVLFITGAGLSADSGMPTYRGVGGLYEDDGTEEGVPIEEALSGRMLRRDPSLCWKHIAGIERACRGATANEGHRVIAALQDRLERCCVLTQNVDGFHRDAGSTDVIEIHGTVHELQCTGARCGWSDRVKDYSHLTIPPAPRCPRPACGAVIRPNVVLFGEMLPGAAVAQLREALTGGFDLVFSIGTTSAFPYIAGPVIEARHRGTPTVEINPADTEVSRFVQYRLRSGAADTLAALAALAVLDSAIAT